MKEGVLGEHEMERNQDELITAAIEHIDRSIMYNFGQRTSLSNQFLTMSVALATAAGAAILGKVEFVVLTISVLGVLLSIVFLLIDRSTVKIIDKYQVAQDELQVLIKNKLTLINFAVAVELRKSKHGVLFNRWFSLVFYFWMILWVVIGMWSVFTTVGFYTL